MIKRTIILLLLILCHSTFAEEDDKIERNVKGTVVYFWNQFFFFDFYQAPNFNSLIDSIGSNRGMKLWSMDSESYSAVISNMHCGAVNKQDSLDLGMDIYYMNAEVSYIYSERTYKGGDDNESSGNLYHEGKIIPFTTYSLRLSGVKVRGLMKDVSQDDCASKFKDLMEQGFEPGTFVSDKER